MVVACYDIRFRISGKMGGRQHVMVKRKWTDCNLRGAGSETPLLQSSWWTVDALLSQIYASSSSCFQDYALVLLVRFLSSRLTYTPELTVLCFALAVSALLSWLGGLACL